MTKTQHTPGPWRRDGFGIYALNMNGVNRMYVTVNQHGVFADGCRTPVEETEANARLIAASPKLLEAGQKALEYLTDHGIDLDGEEEELVAGIRLELHEAVEAATGN